MRTTNRMKASLAVGLLAVAGLAAPASAQNTTTSISIDDGEVEGYSVRIIDGTRYKIEFDEGGVHTAYIDGDEVDFKSEEDVIYIIDDGELIEFVMPELGAAGNAFAIGHGVGERLALLQPGQGNNQNPFFAARMNPKTMVGLTQSSLDDQLREHLDLDNGVGTMILSVVDDLPADEAGLREGDVLIAVDGREVTGADVLTDELRELEPGDELDVTILRKGLPETMTIEVAKFDATRLYGNRFPGGDARGIAAPRILRLDELGADDFRFDVDDNDFDFEDLEDRIRDELADIRELDDEQREEIDRAMAEAREQIARAMQQADRARALQWNIGRGNELLLRNRDNELPLLIEREALRDRARELGDRHPEVVEQQRALEERMHELELRKQELDERREEMQVRSEELRDRNRELTEQNHELRKRLNSLESKLDRLLAHLEDLEDRDER